MSAAPTVITCGSSPGFVTLAGGVARGHHDDEARAPCALDRGVEGVDVGGLGAVRTPRQVDDADPVLVTVRRGPLQRRDDRGHVGGPVPAGHLQRDDVGLRRRALVGALGAGAVAGDQAGDVGPVAEAVDAVPVRREVEAGAQPAAEVAVGRDAGVDRRDGDAVALPPVRDGGQPDRPLPGVVAGQPVEAQGIRRDAGGVAGPRSGHGECREDQSHHEGCRGDESVQAHGLLSGHPARNGETRPGRVGYAMRQQSYDLDSGGSRAATPSDSGAWRPAPASACWSATTTP